MQLVLFTGAWVLIVYAFHSLVARQFKRVDPLDAGVYVTTLALFGVFGEVFGNSLYAFLFGSPLWLYHFTPIHGGYTSLYSIVIWGLYGFYLYLMHDNLEKYEYRTRTLAAIIAVEAIVLELLMNTSFMLVFGGYFFYYLPNDLWHLTSLQAMPLYFLAGVAIIKTLRRFKKDPKFFIIMNAILVFVLTILVR